MDWLDTLKKAALTAKRVGDIDLYNQINELQDNAYKLRQENYKLLEENKKLKDELARRAEGPLEPTEIKDVYGF